MSELESAAEPLEGATSPLYMRFLYSFARRFIAGETLDEAIPKAGELAAQGFRLTLDHLGENVTDRASAEAAVRDYLLLLQSLAAQKLECNISIKLTQIGLDIDEGFCRENLLRVVAEAARVGGFVRVDMEGSAYTERTVTLAQQVHEALPNVGAVIQTMLRRSADDVERLLAARVPIRLVKGAYKEPATVAFPDKRDVDRQYALCMERLLASGVYCAIATHDEALIRQATAIVKAKGLTASDFEFQMLLGIRESLQEQLLADGWRVRIYMPYGAAWLPYIMRRMRERKENFWFVVKNIFQR